MTTQRRIQEIVPGTLHREVLAERTHIYIDWPRLAKGEAAGEVQFDNAWYMLNVGTGDYIAKESQPAPNLNVTLAEVLAFSLPLPEAVTAITGEHLVAFMRAFHSARMEAHFLAVEEAAAKAAAKAKEQAAGPTPSTASLPSSAATSSCSSSSRCCSG